MAVARKATKNSGGRLVGTILRRRAGLGEDIFLFLATFLICAFYQMENHRLNVSNIKSMPDFSGLPASFALLAELLLTYGMQLFRAGFAVLFVITLLVLSLSNGVLKRWHFVPVVAALLLLPQLGLALLGGTRHGDGILRFLYELSVMLGQWPLITLQKLLARILPFSVGLPLVAALAVTTSGLMYTLGYLIARSSQKQ
ncbi:hypothetical protein ACS3UN_10550 [Oscillospiraceae bacterium LTW-04]|nr:hypothetical protein RBH76_12300 [Oscillospiraceae bacterium MB24-C1]